MFQDCPSITFRTQNECKNCQCWLLSRGRDRQLILKVGKTFDRKFIIHLLSKYSHWCEHILILLTLHFDILLLNKDGDASSHDLAVIFGRLMFYVKWRVFYSSFFLTLARKCKCHLSSASVCSIVQVTAACSNVVLGLWCVRSCQLL